jgi:hypothetical protein
MTQQYLRNVQLLITKADGTEAIDLSKLHIRFSTKQWTTESGNTADIRVYNLDEPTAKTLEQDCSGVILNAGYLGEEPQTIFDGTIIQVRRGQHETPADRYCDITAMEGDLALSYQIIKISVGNGSTYAQRLKVIAQALGYPDVDQLPDTLPDDALGSLPRGYTMFGKASDEMRDHAMQGNSNWSIQGGKLQLVAYHGYLQSEVVEINGKTGMIGYPEQSQDGIRVKCLLNPRLICNTRIRLNNGDIDVEELQLGQSEVGANIAGSPLGRPLIAEADGLYRILVLEHSGDTRGQEYYSTMICIALAQETPPAGIISRGHTG